MSFHELYQSMFNAQEQGRTETADRFRIEMEKFRQQTYPAPPADEVDRLVESLPAYAQRVLNKLQTEVEAGKRANCINAAFNFHDPKPDHDTYSTGDFLTRIQSDYEQISPVVSMQMGDLVVLWSRTDTGSWSNRTIQVRDIDPTDPDFPYGLVFDHLAVRITEALVFHKPDPTDLSRYAIDYFNSVITPHSERPGFELTYHRKKLRNELLSAAEE